MTPSLPRPGSKAATPAGAGSGVPVQATQRGCKQVHRVSNWCLVQTLNWTHSVLLVRFPLALCHVRWNSSGSLPVHPLSVPQPLCSDLEDAVINAFSFLSQNLAYEIILTLGQAFEVAYQLALQARKGGHSSTLPESFENKPSKPIPKPRVSIRKSVVSRKDTDVLKTLNWRGGILGAVGAGENPGPALHVLPSASSWHVSVLLSAQFLQSLGDHLPELGGFQENSTAFVPCSSL